MTCNLLHLWHSCPFSPKKLIKSDEVMMPDNFACLDRSSSSITTIELTFSLAIICADSITLLFFPVVINLLLIASEILFFRASLNSVWSEITNLKMSFIVIMPTRMSFSAASTFLIRSVT